MASSTSRSLADLPVEAVVVSEAAVVEVETDAVAEAGVEPRVRAKLRPLRQPLWFLQDCWSTRSTATPRCLRRPRPRGNNEV
jgi:hypothetical protein